MYRWKAGLKMEIERKFLVDHLPKDYRSYPCKQIEQAYLCTEPVVRIRKEDEEYILTYKSKGLMCREEYNLPLDEKSYQHLKSKADGNLISKKRYRIPYQKWTIELDIFEGCFEGLLLAEVEFSSQEEAENFTPVSWFGKEVTWSTRYHNSTLSQASPEEYLKA